ncbi:MAG: hypothetical protein JNM22_06270 [Saprospiraceae bacterium]|nr:hypothetical protein [Saprospiraceae bacterium]
MKNKILAFTAAALLASAIAFGFAQSSSGSGACCETETETCCTSPDQCPIPCCETGSTCQQ